MHLWAYLGEQRGDVVFDFTLGRGAERPKRLLEKQKDARMTIGTRGVLPNPKERSMRFSRSSPT